MQLFMLFCRLFSALGILFGGQVLPLGAGGFKTYCVCCSVDCLVQCIMQLCMLFCRLFGALGILFDGQVLSLGAGGFI